MTEGASVPQTTDFQSITDRVELAELVSRLGRWLDDPASAAPSDLLASDVTVTSPGGTARGREAVVAQATRTHESRVTQHVMTDILADLGGDEASVTSNLLVAFLGAGSEPQPQWISGSRYAFGARRTPAGWRLTSISVQPIWQVGERPMPAAS